MRKRNLLFFVIATGGLIVFAFWRRRRAKSGGDTAQSDEITREISEAERKRVAQEWGRKGAAKSALVRKAKKLAKAKNEFQAQSDLRIDGNGQDLATEAQS